jgi:hypothetical protein
MTGTEGVSKDERRRATLASILRHAIRSDTITTIAQRIPRRTVRLTGGAFTARVFGTFFVEALDRRGFLGRAPFGFLTDMMVGMNYTLAAGNVARIMLKVGAPND